MATNGESRRAPRWGVTAAVAVIAAIGATAAMPSAASATDPAWQLARIDGNGKTKAKKVRKYRPPLSLVARRCDWSRSEVAYRVISGRRTVRRKRYTAYFILRHFANAVTSSVYERFGPENCDKLLSIWVLAPLDLGEPSL